MGPQPASGGSRSEYCQQHHVVPLGQVSDGRQVLESRTLTAGPLGPAWSSVWGGQLDRRKMLVLKRGFPLA